MQGSLLSRAQCKSLVRSLNFNLRQLGTKFRLRITTQSPRIQIRALNQFEDGSNVRTTQLYVQKPGDLTKAYELCLFLQNSDAPLTHLQSSNEAKPQFTAWCALALTLEKHLARKGIQWKGQAYESHMRKFSRFIGPVTANKLMDWVEESDPQSADRIRRLGTLKQLMICAGIEISQKWLEKIKDESQYSVITKAINPRSLPSKSQIEDFVDSIKNDSWRIAFGLIATYGLRPHEVFCISEPIDHDGILEVNSIKTGWRVVIPRDQGWINKWNIAINALPLKGSSQSGRDLGKRVTRQFARYRNSSASCWSEKAQCYDLRHSYAAALHTETNFFSLPTEQIASWMGHSPKVHKATICAGLIVLQ